ncbi:hypothetical protein SAMN05443245_7626 [Paraburkholderia fungorum]|uniref:Uncharacterized protein n=1 Tax=Paraburkholderia fungorum TaxID=134537 RepID=A0A1H1JYR3_9BURK|nr:hypothetical protein [Paraburkholderia fungorum]SDR55201.1 hypothetical protein SAMN05443245_7626 [Paraburkholderia fungorum]
MCINCVSVTVASISASKPRSTSDQIDRLSFGGYQIATFIKPAMGVLEEFVEREPFGGVLSHPHFKGISRSTPDARRVSYSVDRAWGEGGDRRGGQAEPLTDIVQQLAWQCADMIKSVATRPQKEQLDRDAGTAITPKMLVDGGNVAVSHREVALHVEFRQLDWRATLSHIAKFQTWNFLPPIKVARSTVAGGYVIASAFETFRQQLEPIAAV